MDGQTIETFDFYEAAYYLTLGGRIGGVRWMRELGKERFRITVLGEDLADAQRRYLNGNACVNLHEFRRSYQHLRSALFASKRGSRDGEREDV